jgi:hypothetical protein
VATLIQELALTREMLSFYRGLQLGDGYRLKRAGTARRCLSRNQAVTGQTTAKFHNLSLVVSWNLRILRVLPPLEESS